MALAKCRREQRRPFSRFNVNPQMSRNHPLYLGVCPYRLRAPPGVESGNNVSTRHIVSPFPFLSQTSPTAVRPQKLSVFSSSVIARYSAHGRGFSPLIGYVFVPCVYFIPYLKRKTYVYALSFSRSLVDRLFVRHETAVYLLIGQYF